MSDSAQPYTVKMVGATGLSAAQRSAAELRFRTTLELGVGGPQFVVPTLQACMLARSLTHNLPPEELASADFDAEREVIALWERSEGKAIVAACKPFTGNGKAGKSGHVDDARFEISL